MGSGPPPARRREITLALDAGGRGWRGRLGGGGGGSPGDAIRLVGSEIEFTHAGLFESPLVISAGLIAVAAVDRGRKGVGDARFPVLRRLSATAVVPYEEGVEGWLWTEKDGSALPVLGNGVPNLALVFVKPPDALLVKVAMRKAAHDALAERSPLGVPAVFGLLARVADPGETERAFAQLGVDGEVSDREVAPAQRRHRPDDKAANPAVSLGDEARSGSVPPPGS